MRLSLLACVVLAVGCMPPQLPGEKLSDSANDIVMAARFGRMDLVVDAVKPEEREAYLAAHADWGGKVRILDIEYGGAKIVSADKAFVLMTIAWQRIDESVLRSTSLKQTWRLGDRSWMIVKEEVAAGDGGLIREVDPADGDVLGQPKKATARAESTTIGDGSAR